MNRKKLITLMLIILLLSLLYLPQVVSRYVQSVINLLLVNIIIVLGLNFITGLTGQMNIGTAGIWALGAYVYGIFTTNYGLNPWFAMVIIFALGVLIGRALGYPSLRLKGFYLSLTTIGFAEVVRMFITNLSITGGVNGLNNIPRIRVFGYIFKSYSDYYYVLYFAAILATGIAYKIVNSKWGRAFKSIRDNAEASEACGINISSLKIQAFTLASLYACLAGGLYAGMTMYINPTTFTLAASQNYVAMMMIGGIGTVPGSILGALLVTTLPEILRGLGDYYWLVFCSTCLVMAVFVPDGLFSLIKKGFIQFTMIINRCKDKGGQP